MSSDRLRYTQRQALPLSLGRCERKLGEAQLLSQQKYLISSQSSLFKTPPALLPPTDLRLNNKGRPLLSYPRQRRTRALSQPSLPTSLLFPPFHVPPLPCKSFSSTQPPSSFPLTSLHPSTYGGSRWPPFQERQVQAKAPFFHHKLCSCEH